MTRVRDVMSAECVFSQNTKQARVLHHAHPRLSYYVVIVTPGLIKILSQGSVDNE